MPVFVKICGLATPGADSAAIGHGADMLGFRFVNDADLTPEKAAALVAAVPSGMDRVGVFAEPGDAWIGAVVAQAPLDLIQLDGDEAPARVRDIQQTFKLPVIKTVRDLAMAKTYDGMADWLLFDMDEGRAGLRGIRLKRPWLLGGALDNLHGGEGADTFTLAGAIVGWRTGSFSHRAAVAKRTRLKRDGVTSSMI